jgi:spindle assembly abnormal protein 6
MDDAMSSISGAGQNKFIACFNSTVGGTDASLSIVETNQFKALTHLSLSFRKANDEQLKKSLAEKLKDARH